MAKSTPTDNKNAESETAPDALWMDALDKFTNSLGLLAKSPSKLNADTRYDKAVMFDAMASVAKDILAQPDKMVEIQMQAFQNVSKLWTSFLQPAEGREAAIEPQRGDRRFRHPDWTENPLFDQFKQNYLIASQAMRSLVDASSVEDPKQRAIVGFVVDQFLNAVAPTNFAFSNPEVIRKTVETGGANLLAGVSHLIEDVVDGKGVVKRRAPSAFKLGENLACTPGSVVFENDLMQLIQYTPTTETVARRPLIYVPPLVNKYYMIDLRPQSSLIRWLVEQGHTVFVISWVDPDESHRDCALEDYVGRGVIQAMDCVRDITEEKDADLFGFCMGGTFIALTEAVLAGRKESNRVGSSTLIGSLVDFSDMREWAGFVHEGHVDALDSHIGAKGYIAKEELQQLFAMVRANDLIWSSYVDHYLLDREAAPSDLLYWFEDGSHIPQAFLTTYNRQLLLENHLTDPGKVDLLGQKLDLGKIKAPKMIIGLKADHVSAWEAVYLGCKYFGGPVEYVLGGSGHNAGVINPPTVTKHGYWTNGNLADSAEKWIEEATQHEGSWWPHWAAWLRSHKNNKEVPARKVGTEKYPVLENAPGRFVLAGK